MGRKTQSWPKLRDTASQEEPRVFGIPWDGSSFALYCRAAMIQRKSQYQALANETEASTIPTVAVVRPVAEAGDETGATGNPQAYVESPFNARTRATRKWYHDIGRV